MTTPARPEAVRRAAVNVAVNAAAQVVGKVATLAWTLVAARQLSTEGFGTFFYLFAVAQLLSAVVEWGFDAVMVRRGAAQPERLPSLLTANLVWQTAVATPVLGVAAVVLVLSRDDGGERLAVVALLAAVLLDGASDTMRAVGEAAQRQAGVSAAVTGQRIATAAVAVTVLLAGGGVGALAASVAAGSLLGLALHLRAVRRLRVWPQWPARRELAAFVRGTALIGISTLLLMALFRVDTVLLGLLRGESEVAAYSAAYRFLETSLFVAFAVKSAAYPAMSRARRPGEVGDALAAACSTALVVYAPLAAVLLAEPAAMLRLLFGGEYARLSETPLRLLALAPVVYVVAYVGQSALIAVDRARPLVLAAALGLAANVGLNVALLPRYGADAAAGVTTGSYALYAALVLVPLRRAGVRPRLLRPLLAPAVGGAVLGGALVAVRGPLLFELAAGALLYVACWYVVVRWADREQLTLVRSLLRRG